MPEASQKLTPNTWPVGTEVTLMQVPWDANYRDIVIWDDVQQRNAYLDAQALSGTGWRSKRFSYCRPNEPISVPVPYSAAYKYNYVVVQNPMQPVDGEEQPLKLCYFILSTDYVAPGTTQLTLQLDVIQTYQFGVCLGNMFVERGHMGVSNAVFKNGVQNLQGQYLRKYLNVPEGLDVGDSYVMANHEWYPLTDASTFDIGKIIIISSADLAADPGTVDNPNLNVADGQNADGIPSGCNVYSMTLSTFKAVLNAMKEKSWVAQCIQSVSTFPARLLSAGIDVQLFGNSGITMQFLGETDTLELPLKTYATTGNIYQQLSNGVPDGYHNLYKAYTYPYSVIELTAYNGNSVFVKPELVYGNTLALTVIGCAVAPFARIGVFPTNYGQAFEGGQPVNYNQYTWHGFDGSDHTGVIPSGDFLDSCLWLADFPQFSIVNSNYITYLASTAHTRAYQYASAGWQNAKSNAASDLAYSQAMNQTALNESNRYDQGPIGAPQIANYAGHAMGAIESGLNRLTGQPAVSSNEVTLAGAANYIAQRQTGNLAFNATQDLSRQVAGQNLDYAKYAARGDYANQIAAINATVQDAALQAPSTLGQMGGQGFMWKNGLVGFAVNYKTAGGAAMRTVCDFWARYGYKIQRFYNFGNAKMPALKIMDHFSYWKVSETYITCAKANEAEKDAIRGVLEKGVTVWGDPSEIGNIAPAVNTPLYNIEY
nr:MAG TPA: Major tail protein [Caudoviricetes sp.]